MSELQIKNAPSSFGLMSASSEDTFSFYGTAHRIKGACTQLARNEYCTAERSSRRRPVRSAASLGCKDDVRVEILKQVRGSRRIARSHPDILCTSHKSACTAPSRPTPDIVVTSMVIWQARRAASIPHAQSTNASTTRKESALQAKGQCVARTCPQKPWPSSSLPLLPYHNTFSSSPPALGTFEDPSNDPNVKRTPARPHTFSTNDLEMDLHAIVDKVGNDETHSMDLSTLDGHTRVATTFSPFYEVGIYIWLCHVAILC